MNNISEELIKEISEQLDCGFRVHIHKLSKNIIFSPNHEQFSYIDEDENPWAEEIEELEKNYLDYFEIDKWQSREAFDMMVEFTEQLNNKLLQKRLFEALNKRKPFREFKIIIENLSEYRQSWFDFKDKWQQAYVERQLDNFN